MLHQELRHLVYRYCDLHSIGGISAIQWIEREIYNATRRCNLIFERKVWGGLSHMSRDFVRRLLSEDASLRSTAEEALQLFLKKREKMMMMMFILLAAQYCTYLFRKS